MGRDQRPPVTRHRIAAAILLTLCAAGCGGNSYVQAGASGSPSTGVSTGGSVSVQGHTNFGALLVIGILASISYRGEQELPPTGRAPGLDISRRVHEQDCTRPIEDWSANLKCK